MQVCIRERPGIHVVKELIESESDLKTTGHTSSTLSVHSNNTASELG